jgi:hypothetical protein
VHNCVSATRNRGALILSPLPLLEANRQKTGPIIMVRGVVKLLMMRATRTVIVYFGFMAGPCLYLASDVNVFTWVDERWD